MFRKLVLWSLVLICASAIFFFSSQEATDSDKVSYGFIVSIVRIFDFDNSMSDNELIEVGKKLNNIVRVIAHFAIFAALAFFVTLLINEYNKEKKTCFICSSFITFVYACTDEIHQHFVKGRSAQLTDILTDSVGGVCGGAAAIMLIIIVNFYRVKRSHKE